LPNKYDFDEFNHPSLNYKKPKSLQIFNASMVLLFSTIVVVGLWSALWYAVATISKKEISKWIVAQSQYGNEFTYENVSLSGYPSRVVLDYDKPQLKTVQPYNVLGNMDSLTITLKPWTPWQAQITTQSKTTISASTIDADYNFSGKIERLDLLLNPGKLLFDSINLKITKPNFAGTITMHGANAPKPASFSADEINLNAHTKPQAQAKDAAITIVANTTNMVLPLLDAMPLSNHIQSADLALRISGPIATNADLIATLSGWRDGGGRVFVDNLTVHAEPLGFSGGGNIFLDENLQPLGRMSAKIIGLLPTINRFRDLGLIRDADAVVAKMTLAALSQKTSDGRSFLNLGVEIKDRVVYLGPIGIGQLPEINWQ